MRKVRQQPRMLHRGALAAPGVGLVHGTAGLPVPTLRTWLSDRKVNGEAFDGERVVRLPRKWAGRRRYR